MVYTGHLNGIYRYFSKLDAILCCNGRGELCTFPTLNQFCGGPVSIKQLLTLVAVTVLGVTGRRRLQLYSIQQALSLCAM